MTDLNEIELFIIDHEYKLASEKIMTLNDSVTRDCWFAVIHACCFQNEKVRLITDKYDKSKLSEEQRFLLTEGMFFSKNNKKHPSQADITTEDIALLVKYSDKSLLGCVILGWYYWYKRDATNSLYYYKKIIKIKPECERIQLRIIQMLVDFKEFKKASEEISKLKPSLRRGVDTFFIKIYTSKGLRFVIFLFLFFLTNMLGFPYNLPMLLLLIPTAIAFKKQDLFVFKILLVFFITVLVSFVFTYFVGRLFS